MRMSILGIVTLAIVTMPIAIAADTKRVAKPEPVKPATPVQPAKVKKTKPDRAGKKPYDKRIPHTPDINQNMTIAELLEQIPAANHPEFTPPSEINVNEPFFMANMCAPASVTDHLLWLDKLHFKNITKEKHPVVAGVRLINTLGSKDYMNTVSGGSGTSIYRVVRGTYKFLEERGIDVKKVTIVSKSAHPYYTLPYHTPVSLMQIEHRMPHIDETKAALHKRAIVLNLFGKYNLVPKRYNKETKKTEPAYLKRDGGHYFAPVGYGQIVKTVYQEDVIVYNNPAGEPQNKQQQEYIRWFRESGSNAKLRMIKKSKSNDPFRACEDNESWTCYGTLGDSYVRDKPLKDHGPNETVRVLEALIVIEV